MDWIDQLVPFQASANVVVLSLLPTAVQAVSEVHDTALRLNIPLSWADQLVPSQRSTTVTMVFARTLYDWPTAMHAVLDVQETPFKSVSPTAAPTSEIFWIAQLVPVHASANVW